MSAVMEKRVTPERSRRQRLEALERANEVRSYRSELKRDLKYGRRFAWDVLVAPDERVLSMKVFELLLAMPKHGRVKVQKALNMAKVSPSKTVGGLTDRQRHELQVYLPALRVIS